MRLPLPRAAAGGSSTRATIVEADGTWAGGSFTSTYMDGARKPTIDPDDRGLGLLRDLTELDFAETGARFTDSGKISPPDVD